VAKSARGIPSGRAGKSSQTLENQFDARAFQAEDQTMNHPSNAQYAHLSSGE
jgi:hypothetical protein